jgi:hypothetical protein
MAVPRLHINEILYLLVYTDDWGVVLFVRGTRREDIFIC